MTPNQRKKLREVVAEVLCCPAVWDEEPRPMIPAVGGKLATLSQNSALQPGFFDRRYRNTGTGPALVIEENLTSLVTHVISVRLELVPPGSALDVLAELRFSLWTRSIQASLKEEEIAVQRVVSLVKVPGAKVDTRILSTAVCDLRITCVESYRGEDQINIGSAELEHELEP